MKINVFSKTGVYLLLLCAEQSVPDIITDNGPKVFLNFEFENSIKVPHYYKHKKLRTQSSLIQSTSSHPNQLYSVALSLLEKYESLVVSTVGLSKESICSIIADISTKFPDGKQIVFVHSSDFRKIDDFQLVKIESGNLGEIARLL